MDGSTQQGNSKCVLLVDDEDRLRGVLARYLRALGHDVLEASTVVEAQAYLERARIDVLLLDINLPDDTGWSVLRWLDDHAAFDPLRQRPCVVILSAVPPSPKRIEQFAPHAVLNKPFPIDALGRLVAEGCAPAPRVEGRQT